MKSRVLLSLLKKEFLNIVRDRKSFIIMILLPLLMFPMMIGLMSLILTTFTKVDGGKITIGVNYNITSDFKEFVDNYSDNYEINIIYEDEDKLKEDFKEEKISLYVIKDENNYVLHLDENSTTKAASNSIIKNLYADYKEIYITNRLSQMGIDYEEVKNEFALSAVQENITQMGSLIPSVISMALVMIISSVCFSIAIDVTTSEKEKGTLETLLSLPISKTELVTSKFITVFTLSALSGFLAYISLFCTLGFARGTLSMIGVSSITVDFRVLFVYLISIILISLLFSGLLLSATIFSKNLKEAQNSLYPLELFVTFISMLPMFGVKASIKYALIPFVNISLLFNNVLSSVIDPLFVVLTFASTIVYSIILIIIISKLYNSEDVLFNSKALSYLSFKNGKSKTVAFSPLTAILIAVIILLLDLYFSLMFITSSKYLLLAMMPITTFIVIGVASLLTRFDVKEGFKLNKFKFKKFFNLIMLYIGVYIVANYVVNFIAYLFPKIVSDYSAYSSLLSFDNVFIGILIVAVLPAIFEELLFRGVIYNSFNKRYGLVCAIIVSSLLFGVYHMNVIQGVYASIFGLMLAYSYYKTDSIFVPIIFHFINNFIATVLPYIEPYLIELSNWLNIGLFIIGVVLTIIALFININDKKLPCKE